MMHRRFRNAPRTDSRRLTFRRFAALLLAAIVIDGVLGLQEQPLIAEDESSELALQVVPQSPPAISAALRLSTRREVFGLLFLLAATVTATRLRHITRRDMSKTAAVKPARPLSSGRLPARPIRVLELRTVWGTGGGPEKTILLGARPEPSSHAQVTVCYVHDRRDHIFNIHDRAREVGIDYVEIVERSSFDLRTWTALARLIREKRIDIVHSHDYKANLLALAAGRLGLAVPLSTAHGWNPTTLRESALYYPADKRLLATFPHAIAVSSLIRDELVAYGARPDRVSVILNGIDVTTFTRRPSARAAARAHFGLARDQFVIGAIGRLSPEKGFDTLLHAFATLRSRLHNLALLIAGDGPERAALERLATDLQLGNTCRFLGQQSNIVEIHHALDLFVQSSLTEGTPNVVLEAMAMQTPIVATSAGGTGELVQDGVHALIVSPGDQTALVRAMRTAIGNPEAATARTVLARARVETDLSFDGRRRAVEAIYYHLLADGRRQAA